MYKQIFTERIRKIRKQQGYTQKEVEQETGIAQTKISKIENGKGEPDMETLGILIDFYEISANWLLGTGIKGD